MERFYEIVSQDCYVSSNSIGSHIFYAVELGLPFFLFGPSTEKFNKNNENFQQGKIKPESQNFAQRTRQLFSKKVDEPTSEQIDFVEKELGVKDTISRFRAAFILYKSLLQFLWWKVKRKLIHWDKEDDLPPLLGSR